MATGGNVSYNRYGASKLLSTAMLVVPKLGEHGPRGSVNSIATRYNGLKIIAVDTGTKKFTVESDVTDVVKDGDTVVVRASNQSAGNDGTYTVNGDSVLSGSDTEIVVNEAIADTTVCGVLDVGSTGKFTALLMIDSNETAGEQDLQDAWRVTGEVLIENSGDGSTSEGVGDLKLKIQVTPILGGGSEGAASTYTTTHDETMDAWQTAAGRARQ